MAHRTEVLKLVLEDVVGERDRLRNARGTFSRQLGPLPAAAAIVVGFSFTSAGKLDRGWIVAATVLFLVLIWIGILYGDVAPYRLIRAQLQPDYQRAMPDQDKPADRVDLAFDVDSDELETWLLNKIRLEQEIYGPLRPTQRFSLKRLQDMDLQQALDVERSAVWLVQTVFAEIVLVLVVGIFMHDRHIAGWWQALVALVVAVLTAAALLHRLARGEARPLAVSRGAEPQSPTSRRQKGGKP